MQAEIKTQAIVIRAVPYGESDMIITLVGVDGRLTATARGCLKRGAKLRFAAEPFNFGEYVLVGKNGRYTVKECNQLDSFSRLTSDIERYYAGCMILDALGRLSEEPSVPLFMSALTSLGDLAYSDKDADGVLTGFLLKAISLGGGELNFAHCNVCKCVLDGDAAFSDADGIVCKHCAGVGAIPIEGSVRAYLAGESEPARPLRVKANILLCDIVYFILGVRLNTGYLTEQL